ncbi:alpha-L-rhamnosidase [Catenovulum maritimum]|uniref:alpha-L-rhamnosidase n=1 Tax=Catenovulum maritimum TaxID=1513271 RepID=A0A0J8JK26_9ALTE|nr:alpha-L-rhamnosidase [Catenovulum maritimum]KMT64811.1 rhamnosidase [Catenovulum maritimum]
MFFCQLKQAYKAFWLCIVFLTTACGVIEPSANKLAAPVNLKVGEGFVNPIGYYESLPRFSWQLPEESEQKQQQSYQIQVASSVNFTAKSLLWDTAKINSNSNAWIRYQGQPLTSRQQVFWRVKTWDEQNQMSSWSEVQSIELGLLGNHDWLAKWVGHPNPDGIYNRPQYLRKIFNLDKPIAQARLYITAKGIFKPYLNGKAISNDVMTPGWTPYHKRIETLTYDITQHLKQGENAIGAVLAEGWHTGRIFGPTKKDYVLPMRLIAQLEVQYTDGTTNTIKTDESWQSSVQGPVRSAGNYDGETYDANFEMPGWNTVNFDDSDWLAVNFESIDTQVQLKPKRHAAASNILKLPAVEIVSVKDGVAIFDMGQNMVGVPEIQLPAKQGQAIKLRFSEALEHGQFYVKNYRSAKSTDFYTPKADGVINYRPQFTFHGYRYVEVSGYDTNFEPELAWLSGHVLHSNFTLYDNFKSNHSKLNKLSDNVSWGLRGNFLDVPTDCPQRDERLGWTGDAQVFVSTSMYKADVYAFWAAWLESLREDQGIDGMIPKFVPFRPFLTDGTAAAWGDAATIVPWELYQYTADINVLAENYSMMKRWIAYTEFHSFDYISNIGTYGDWLQPYSTNGRAKGDTHPDLIATAYYARSVEIAAQTADLLGYKADAEQYNKLFLKIKQKFRNYFFDQELNLVSTAIKTIKRDKGKRLRKPIKSEIQLITTQTSYLLPLAFNLFNQHEQDLAVSKLLALLKESDNHLKTGFLGTPMLHQILQRYGHSDLMYEILLKETYPSWFYSINHGATTTWERWDSYSLTDGYNKANMNSLNHYAYGAVAQWFYNGMLGIQALEPGFKRFEINPQFTSKLNNLNGSVPTINGDIKVYWQIRQGKLSMTIDVPKNTQAQLNLPSVEQVTITQNKSVIHGNKHTLEPGLYQISGVIRF